MIKDNNDYNQKIKPNSAFLNELKDKLPQFFTKDDNFDLNKFEETLEKENINELSEGYQLDFIGKDYARRQSGEMPTTVIVPDEKQNKDNNSQNLFFTGDNLDVLKHLQANYSNKIDVIYIDPPYNTGNGDFIYPDKFEYPDEKLKIMFGLDDEGIKRLKSIQGNSNHSAWLTFMYPRLYLAKKILSDKGVIFISIDENELANLTLLMNNIFGESQFKVQFAWSKTSTPPSLSNYSRRTTDYILTFEKNSFGLKYYGSDLDNDDVPLINSSNNEIILKLPPKSCYFFKYNNTRISPKKFKKIDILSEILIKNHENMNEIIIKGKIRWSQNKINQEISNGTKIIFKSIDLNPRFKRINNNSKYRTPNTNLDKELGVLTNEMGVKRLEKLSLKNMFTNPKPTSLIKYLIKMVSNQNNNITVMDFFAGSSTTADAVMQLNAEDGGNRKFIMVQLPEKTYRINNNNQKIPTKGGKVAFDSGYNSIDEVSIERIKRSFTNIKENAGLILSENFDGSFKHYNVVNPNQIFLDEIENFDSNNINLFTKMVDKFSGKFLGLNNDATGEQTILTTWLAADGYPFNIDVIEINYDDYKAYLIDNNRLYLISEGWNSKKTKILINQIGNYKLNIQTIVLFGYSFNIAELKELENGLNQLDINVNLIKRY